MLRICLCAAVCVLLPACLSIGGRAPSSGITPSLGPPRALPPTFYGVNFDYGTTAAYASDPDLDQRLAALDPGTLRYPGGTGANVFSWQTGAPAKVVDGFHLTLPALAAASRATGAVPVFDLNIATSTLADQITMLQQAHSLGLPVRYVELGNEVYSGFPDVKKAFPTAADYGAAVGTDVPQLHAAFPGVLVGADGYLRPNPPLRDRDWNRLMLAAAVAHGGLPDALILHAYAAAPAGALQSSEVPSLLEEPYQEIDAIQHVIAAVPSPAPSTVWLTEYNLRPRVAASRASQPRSTTLRTASCSAPTCCC